MNTLHIVLLSIVVYLILIAIIVYWKPSLVFDKHGNPKPFGVGKDKTILSFGVIVVLLGILSFFTIAFIYSLKIYK